ncbi:MAG: serine hydrolase [Phycisphaerales bacterium]|nr:serine hydrolase [Phycisphaerales bacterium]
MNRITSLIVAPLLALGSALLITPTALAQAPATEGERAAPESIFIPSTPTGQRLAWLMRLLNEDIEVSWKANFSLGFTRRVTQGEFFSNLDRLRERSGGWDLMEVRYANYNDAAAILRMHANQTLWQLELRVEPFEPFKIDGLRLLPAATAPYERLGSWDDITSALTALPGTSSLTVYEVESNGGARRIYDHEGDRQMAVGAVSGLYLTACVLDTIEQGESTWQMPVMVVDELKSLPPGDTFAAKDGSVVGVSDLVRSMYATGDHSAFDHLLHHLGRERVESWLRGVHSDPERMMPFLASRELAALKYAKDPALLERYAAADSPEARRVILDRELHDVDLSALEARGWSTPREIERVGWFACTNDTCLVLARMVGQATRGELDLLDAAPTLPFDRITWPRVVFKAGAEPGVLSVAMLLRRSDQRQFAVAFTTNNPEAVIDGEATHPIVMSTIEMLGEMR